MGEEDLVDKILQKNSDDVSEQSSDWLDKYATFYPDYTLSDFFESTLKSHSPSELTDHFMKYLSKFGLDRIVMSEMSFDNTHQKEKHHGVLVNFPEDWMKHYLENHYIEYDAIYSMAMTARRPFLWQDVKDDIRTNAKGKLILEEAREFKLCDGIGLSIHKPFGEIIGMGLASSVGGVEPNDVMLMEIYAAAHQFYLVYSDLYEKTSTEKSQYNFTARELEVLLWLSRGKTIPEIAIILGLSEAGIKFHRQNIYKKFGVDNCRSAVMKAVRMGLVKPF